jgi:hypothetical protein
MTGPDRTFTRREIGELYQQMWRLRRLAERAVVGPAWHGLESIPAGVLVALGPGERLALGDPASDDHASDGLACLAAVSAAARSGGVPHGRAERRQDDDRAAPVVVAAPGLAGRRLRELSRQLAQAGGPALLVMPPQLRWPRPGEAVAAGLAAALRAVDPLRFEVDGLDAVAVGRSVDRALRAARAAGTVVRLEPVLLDPDLAAAAGRAVHDPHCDPIERLHAWGRDHGLLDQCDCAQLERAVEAEVEAAVAAMPMRSRG